MRITYIIARFYPWYGGAERNCLELAKIAVTAGHQVTVLTTDLAPNGGRLPREETLFGIRIRRFHTFNSQLNLGFYPELLSFLLTHKTDIIHVENGPGMIWQEFCLAMKRITSRQIKFIATPHGPFLATPHTHTGWKLQAARVAKKVMLPYFKLVWPWLFDKIIAINPLQHEWLQRDYRIHPTKIILINNGIPADYIPVGCPTKPTAEIIISAIGRLEQYKRFPDIVSALGTLHKKLLLPRGVRAVLMGAPGNALGSIQALVKRYDLDDKVEVVVSPPDSYRDDILAKSSIHILPSEWEGTGIVLLEAMAMGNALISSTGNEAAELLITEGANGYIFPTGDVDTLASYIYKLLCDKKLLNDMMLTSWQLSHELTWEKAGKVYLELLADITNNT